MAAPRYVQFLVDLQHVHRALEAAILAVPSVATAKQYGKVLRMHVRAGV